MKKNDLKKGLCALLACVMAVSLAACGSKDGNSDGSGGSGLFGGGGKNSGDSTAVAAADPSKAKEGVFREQKININTGDNDPNLAYAGRFSDGVGMIYGTYTYNDS